MSRSSALGPWTCEADGSDPTDRALAPADTEAVTFPATTSPLNNETTIASANDCVAAADPGEAKTAARDLPTLSTDPSAGYWNDCTSEVVESGQPRSPREIGFCPGIVMRTRKAVALVVALFGGGAPAASVAEVTRASATATASRITGDQGSAPASGASSTRAVSQPERGGARRGV